jgi:hypothetical protein
MHPEEFKVGNKPALAPSVSKGDDGGPDKLLLAVVTEVAFMISWSKLQFVSGKNEVWSAATIPDCRLLAGELVIVDLTKQSLTSLGRGDLVFRLLKLDRLM